MANTYIKLGATLMISSKKCLSCLIPPSIIQLSINAKMYIWSTVCKRVNLNNLGIHPWHHLRSFGETSDSPLTAMAGITKDILGRLVLLWVMAGSSRWSYGDRYAFYFENTASVTVTSSETDKAVHWSRDIRGQLISDNFVYTTSWEKICNKWNWLGSIVWRR